MPQYRALENCFIDNCYHREGDVFEYSGPPCAVLERVGSEPEPVEQDDPAPALRRPGRPRKTSVV